MPGAIVAFLIVLFTYQLNTGPFNFHVYNYVVILFSSHGHILLFPLTAIAGCALILLIAGMTRTQKTIVWLGQNTFILMCLNGIFYHYINPPAAKWVLETFPNSALSIFGVGIIMTVASLALCIPIIFLFNKFVPQLVGKPKLKGLLLKKESTFSMVASDPLHYIFIPAAIIACAFKFPFNTKGHLNPCRAIYLVKLHSRFSKSCFDCLNHQLRNLCNRKHSHYHPRCAAGCIRLFTVFVCGR